MATLREYRSDIELIAERLNLSVENNMPRTWIEHKIHTYRERGIREQYQRNQVYESIWIQELNSLTVTTNNFANDPDIAYSSMGVGVVTIPPIVAIGNEEGLFEVMETSKMKRYYPTTRSKYLMMSGYWKKHNWYWLIGNTLYISPCKENVSISAILANPLDGFVYSTEKVLSDNLIVGQNYTVYDTQIVHNSIAYNPGQSFVAANASYTGNGYVMFTNKKRKMTIDDEYPMSGALFHFVLTMIFTVDFQFTRQQLADAINDLRDSLKAEHSNNEQQATDD